MTGPKVREGVLIIVQDGPPVSAVPGLRFPAAPIDSCALVVYPTGEPREGLRITRVYCPPPPSREDLGETARRQSEGETTRFKPSLVKMRELMNSDFTQGDENDKLRHLIVGDLNPREWENAYHDWMEEGGAWELPDPEMGTHSKGGALDKVIFQPWAEVPRDFLGPADCEEGLRED